MGRKEDAALRELVERVVAERLAEAAAPKSPAKKMGRPVGPRGKRDKRVFVMMTAGDVEALDAWAMEHGMTRSSAVLHIVRERVSEG